MSKSRHYIPRGAGGLYLSLILAACTTGRAQTHAPPVEAAIHSNLLDKAHASMSSGALLSANWLDAFFANDLSDLETSTVCLNIGFVTFLQENEDPSFDVRVRLRMRLPSLSERLRIEISGEPGDDKVIEEKSPQQQVVDSFEGTDTRHLAAELQYLLRATKRANISLSSGLRYRSGLPVVYLGPRYRRFVDLDGWDLRFDQRVRWFSDNGWEARTRFDIERPLPLGLFFRTSTGGSWLETYPENFFYDVSFIVYQPLSNRRTIAYEWNNVFSIEPSNHLDEINFRLRYRQRIWRDWIYVEVAPQISFPWDDYYEREYGVLLKLDTFFGNSM